MGQKVIWEKARAAGLATEDYVELLVQANDGVALRVALQLGVAPNAVQQLLRKGLEKRTRATVERLLPNGNPRWIIRAIQYSNTSPKAKPTGVVLVVEEDGHEWEDAGLLAISGATPEELYANIADIVSRCDAEAWLQSDGTIQLKETL